MRRIAFIVSHPIQYYAPLHQLLAQLDGVQVKVFFTWHDGSSAVQDAGFKRAVAWDIPLTHGYDFEMVPNVATRPGTHHFFGLRNPTLVDRVLAWQPDVVHITGWAWASHLWALRAFHRLGIPTLFRGDSHLLDAVRHGPRWWLKKWVLSRVFSWASGCLYVGQANRAYYEAFGVPASRLHYCPHSIDVQRFAEPAAQYEQEAAVWRQGLAIKEDAFVLLFAGKFEPIKQPLQLMQAFNDAAPENAMLIMLGDGELKPQIASLAVAHPTRFRLLPFQNQSKMPVVYRLGDWFVLPSACETWGLAVNEALACGRQVLISDRVGCAADVVSPAADTCGTVFQSDEPASLRDAIRSVCKGHSVPRDVLTQRAWDFDIGKTARSLLAVIDNTKYP